MSGSAVQMRDVRFVWPGRKPFGMYVKDFSVASGERLLLLGQSGSGKSTLLSLLAGIVNPQQGSVIIADTDIGAMPSRKRDRFRADNIGLIFQSLNLVPYLSTIENVLLPLQFSPERRRRADQVNGAASAAGTMLDRLGLPQKAFANLPAHTLSVGQQQRVAVARAMIGEPRLIIADEPTSALDSDHRAAFMDLLGSQLQCTSTTLIMVSHDRALVPFFDRSVELGTIVLTERSQ